MPEKSYSHLEKPFRFIVDAHEDIAYNAVLGRDFRLSALEKRKFEIPPDSDKGIATVGLPELLQADVRIVFATLWAAPCNMPDPKAKPCYETPQQAYDLARKQLEYYNDLAKDPRIALIRSRTDIDRVLKPDSSLLGVVLLMEGADPIITPQQAREWFEAGVRIVGPAWHATRYAGGTQMPGPLTGLGRELMKEMEKTGLILDISHIAEASFFEALELFHGPVIASHSNCRTIVPTDRQLSDEMISALIARESVIGTVLYNKFLQPDWKQTDGKSKVTLADVVKHISHVCDLAGDRLHVGIGSDFDGGFGAESIPAELDTAADLQKISEALGDVGFSQTDIDNTLGGNWVRLLRRALP
ncbi:MAG: membrane dipeptidase [Candidatus Bathyarchaeia archaeon]|jgi:membrane dipeptidase